MRLTLRTKIAIFVTLIIFIFSGISTYFFVSQHKRHIEEEFISRGNTLSYLLSKIAAEGLAAEKLDLINRASFIIKETDVIRADVYTELWDIVESYSSEKKERPLHSEAVNHFSDSDTTLFIKHNNEYDFYQKVLFQPFEGAHPIHVGFVVVDLSMSRMQKTIDSMIKTNILTSLMITFIAVLALNILIRRLIGKPVMDLHNSVMMFKDGFVHEIKTSYSSDEIGDLARKFNEMSKAVREKEDKLVESERNIASIFERVEHAIFRLDKDGSIIKANGKFQEIFGENAERLCDVLMGNKTVHDYFGKEGFKNKVKLEEKVVGKKGEELVVLLSIYPDIDDKSGLKGFDGYMLNITDRKKAENNIRLASKVMESTTEGIFIMDRNFSIQIANPAFTDITGFAINEVIGRSPDILSPGRHFPEHPHCKIWASVKENNFFQGEVWNRRKNGEAYPAQLSVNTIRDESGEASYYVGVFTDITQRKLFEDHLKSIAHYDVLTGLPNRALFNDRLSHSITLAHRTGQRLALLYLDLDGLKQVNDTLGHETGDLLLQEVSHRLKGCVRESDTVARIGGDEFNIILLNIKDAHDAAVPVSRNILSAINKPFNFKGNECKVGISIGISLYPEDGSDASTLIKNADTAMYHVKNSGKNNYRLFSSEMNDAEI